MAADEGENVRAQVGDGDPGYLLDHLGHDELTGPMLESLRARGSLPWTELNRQEARDPDFAPEPRQRDLRWRIIVRRLPQLDA